MIIKWFASDCSIFLNVREVVEMLLGEGVVVGDWVDPVSGFVVSGCVMLLDGGEVVGVFGLGVVGLENVERSCQRVGLLVACWLYCFYCYFPSL